jgi:hypothetical protein
LDDRSVKMTVLALDGWLGTLTFVAALGCGLVGGVFFAFSTFVCHYGAPPGRPGHRCHSRST